MSDLGQRRREGRLRGPAVSQLKSGSPHPPGRTSPCGDKAECRCPCHEESRSYGSAPSRGCCSPDLEWSLSRVANAPGRRGFPTSPSEPPVSKWMLSNLSGQSNSIWFQAQEILQGKCKHFFSMHTKSEPFCKIAQHSQSSTNGPPHTGTH